MKLAKDKKIIISISLIIILLAVSIIGIISRGIQTTTGISTDLENAKDASVVQSNSTLTVTSAEWAKAIGGDKNDEITSVISTSDGGYLVGGNFYSSSIDLGNGVTINNATGISKGMIIKYNSAGVVQWAKTMDTSSSSSVTSVIQTTDGGYLVGGTSTKSINLGNGVNISINTESNNAKGIIIKYNSTGVAQWGKAIGGDTASLLSRVGKVIQTIDGGYLVGGYFAYKDVYLENGVSIISPNIGRGKGLIIKYNSSGIPQWGKAIGGSDYADENITSIIQTTDGGYLVGGYFASKSIDLGNNVNISNSGSDDAMIIKYNSAGVTQWAKSIGGSSKDKINTIEKTRDGGYIVGGEFASSSLNLGNNIILNHVSANGSDGMIIKYNNEGVAQWAKAIDASNNESVTSILETQDGGFLAGIQLSSSPLYIIKYNNSGNVQWQKSINANASRAPTITSIVGTKDGGYVVGGSFYSANVNIGNNVSINNYYTPSGGTFTSDGMLMKFRDVIAPTVTVKGILNGNTQTSIPYAKSRSMTITVADEGGSGLSSSNSYQYYLSTSESALTGGAWTNYTPGETFTLGEGKTGLYHLFIKTVSDNIGNISAGPQDVMTIGGIQYHSYMAVFLDNTPPTAGTMNMKLGNSTGLAYTNNTYTNQNVYIEAVNGTDEHSGHKSTTYSVSGPITLENQTAPTTLTEEGTYTITVTTEDNIGLTATRSYTVKIDRILPTAGTMTMKLGGSTGPEYTNDTWTKESVYISPVDGSSEHSGHKSTTYSVNGPKTLINQTTPTILTETGVYEITVKTTDNAGNTATNLYTVKIDKTAPTCRNTNYEIRK